MQTLLIDDNPTVVFLTQRLFHRQGLEAKLTTFLSPVAAVSYLRQQVLASTPPCIVLLDLNMPLMSGWDVLEAFKSLEPSLRGRCAIYILTSSLAPADKVRSRDYPLVVGLIHKPLDLPKIQAIQAQVSSSGN